MWDGLDIDGFQFDDSMEYARAKKEADIISFILDRMNVSDPQVALKVYYKLLERNDMNTVVGLTFLKQLRDHCVNSGIIDKSELKPIPILGESGSKGKISSYGDATALATDSAIYENSTDMEEGFEKLDKKIDEEFAETEKLLKRDIKDHINRENKLKLMAEFYHNKVKKCYYIIAALAAVIVILFILAISSKSLPFSDTEEAIQDKYAAWAEELSAREEALNLREEALEGEE